LSTPEDLLKFFNKGEKPPTTPVVEALHAFQSDKNNLDLKASFEKTVANSIFFTFKTGNSLFVPKINDAHAIIFFSDEYYFMVAWAILSPALKVANLAKMKQAITAREVFLSADNARLPAHLNALGPSEDSYLFSPQDVRDFIRNHRLKNNPTKH
jgi:hypothetical protein